MTFGVNRDLLFPGDWVEQASCAGMDTDLFYEPAVSDELDALRQTCDACPVLSECTQWVLRSDEAIGVTAIFGFCAGMTVKERRSRVRGKAIPEEGI